jgi:hypothetical protein
MHGKIAIEEHFVTPAPEDLIATRSRTSPSAPGGWTCADRRGRRTKIGRDNAALLGL